MPTSDCWVAGSLRSQSSASRGITQPHHPFGNLERLDGIAFNRLPERCQIVMRFPRCRSGRDAEEFVIERAVAESAHRGAKMSDARKVALPERILEQRPDGGKGRGRRSQ